MIAAVLRSYSCGESEKFAYWLQERLDTPRYGEVLIDPNEGLSSADSWYDEFRRLVAEGRYMIALLSPELNLVDDTDHYPGISLASEILYFWRQQQDDSAFASNLLIPIFIDCDPAELARPKGEYEQLQDIVVPYVSALDPLYVTTESFYGNTPETFKLSDSVALRMGIQPLMRATQTIGVDAGESS
ncbi:MAG TPA: hypothetical protein VH988_11460 [Thermoanaerobaculia bacterium]|nr:hypothetical protein [Thermoanaerobaculia bacterium]